MNHEPDCDDERAIELSSIRAIFPELTIDDDNPYVATLDLEVAPTEPLQILFKPRRVFNAFGAEVALDESHKFEHLPALHLTVQLPEGYPDQQPPVFQLEAKDRWLPSDTLDGLSQAGRELWEEYGRSQVVYAYIDYLQQEAERGFGLQSAIVLDADFRAPLVTYNRETKRRKFEEVTYHCGICLDPKKGTVCHKMWQCGHVFCRLCLQDFYNGAITEGDVGSVKCLDPDCGTEGLTPDQRRAFKAKSIHPKELLEIPLERKQVQRYVDMKVKKRFESDKNAIFCPREFCQKPARRKRDEKYLVDKVEDYPDSSDSEPEEQIEEANPTPNADGTVKPKPKPEGDRLAICSGCSFAFCRICKKSWHGDFVICRPQIKFNELSEEDKASLEYIRLNTSLCPSCDAPCQKTHGCNHMRCYACNTHFCYLCSAWLLPDNPYKHFNTAGTECFMRLWELEEGDEDPNAMRNPNIFMGARRAEIDWQAEAFAAVADAEADRERQDDATMLREHIAAEQRLGL